MYFVPFTRDARDVRQLSRLVDTTFDRAFTSAVVAQPEARSPALDVAESDRAYTVTLDVPGVAKEDLQVSVDGRRVTVRTQQAGDKPAAAEAPAGDTTAAQTSGSVLANADRIVYRERSVARYARSFTLPVEVEQADAGAKLENGVLTLTLPKRNPRVAAQVTVN